MRLSRLATGTYRRMPWKNGGGVTLEIALSPSGAGLDDFDWRISSAHVEAAGRFSTFSGIDRSLALLGGARMDLIVAGRLTALVQGGPPFSFDGGAAVHAELPAGGVTDFNVMSRRGRWTHRLQRIHLDRDRELRTEADVVLFYCVTGPVSVSSAEHGAIVLEAGDALIAEGASQMAVHLAPSGPASLLVARLWRVDSAMPGLAQWSG